MIMSDPDQMPEPDTDVLPDNEEDEAVVPKQNGITTNKDRKNDDAT